MAIHELASWRSALPLEALKPVVYFQSAQPAVVHLQVHFAGGRPWTACPEPSDYVEALRPVPEERATTGPAAGLRDRPGLSPPWVLPLAGLPPTGPLLDDERDWAEILTGDVKLNPRLPAGDLRRRYEVVPWIIPNHTRNLNWDGSAFELGGLGLEWRGLRLGFGEALEGPLPPVEGSSFWARLREVPAAAVALRGDHERFLFYEGSVGLPAPVRVSWSDAGRRALHLRVRSFEEYPLDLERLANEGRPPPSQSIPGVLVAAKEPGSPLRGRFIPNLPPRTVPVAVELASLDLEGDRAVRRLEEALVEEGLTMPEAHALIETWRQVFFETPGLRAITILPEWIYRAYLPMNIRPRPEELVRVGLVWKECGDLEVDPPAKDGAEREASSRPCSSERIEIARSPLQVRELPLELGPIEPFPLESDGRLPGVWPQVPALMLSADGTKVLVPFHLQGSTSVNLHVGDLEARAIRQVASLPAGQWWRAISAAGNRVAFAAREEDVWTIRVADLARGVLLEVFRSPLDLSGACFSSDGTAVAFVGGALPRVLDLETRELLEPQVVGHCESPALSPDGDRLALTSLDLEDRSLTRLLVVDLRRGTLQAMGRKDGILGHPLALPREGARVLIQNLHRDLFLLADLESCRLSRLGLQSLGAMAPSISADGRRVLVVHGDGFWSIDLETGRARKVLELPGKEIGDASVSTDHRRVLFSVWEGGKRVYRIADLK